MAGKKTRKCPGLVIFPIDHVSIIIELNIRMI